MILHGREMRERLAQRDGNRCHVCEGVINMTLSPDHEWGPTIEHVLPLANGGTNAMSNLRLSHLGCNRDRGSAPMDLPPRALGQLAQVAADRGWDCRWCGETCDPARGSRDAVVSVRQKGGKSRTPRLAHRDCENSRWSTAPVWLNAPERGTLTLEHKREMSAMGRRRRFR